MRLDPERDRARSLERREPERRRRAFLAQEARAEVEDAAPWPQRLSVRQSRPDRRASQLRPGPLARVGACEDDLRRRRAVPDERVAACPQSAVGDGEQRLVDALELRVEASDLDRPAGVAVDVGHVAAAPAFELVAEDELERRSDLVVRDEHEPGADAQALELRERAGRRLGEEEAPRPRSGRADVRVDAADADELHAKGAQFLDEAAVGRCRRIPLEDDRLEAPVERLRRAPGALRRLRPPLGSARQTRSHANCGRAAGGGPSTSGRQAASASFRSHANGSSTSLSTSHPRRPRTRRRPRMR